jgi:YVTN family beta-propeller protein
VIDTGSDTVASAIEVGKSPHGLAITPDGRTLLVADFGTDTVVFIDTTSMKIIGRTASPSPHNIAIGPDGDVAYVGDQAKGKTAIQVLDIASMKEKAGVPLDKAPRALGLNKDGSKLYFTLAGADEVQVLDTKSLSLAKTIPVGASPHHPLFTADGTLALVVSQGPGELSIIDAASDTVLARVKVGKLPHWIAQSSDGRRAFVTNEGSNDISIVDLDTRSLTGTVAVGSAPRKIAVIGKAALGAAPLRTTIAAFAFADTLKAAVGQSVVWTNADAVPHTVTGDGGLWDSGDIEGGKSFTMRFDKPGTYSYYCKYHPMMRGTVLVGAAE